jgi:hypothetical protein
MDYMMSTGLCFYLKASVALICDRIGAYPAKRPMLRGMNREEMKQFIAAKLDEREPVYLRAHHVLNVPGLTAEALVKSMV